MRRILLFTVLIFSINLLFSQKPEVQVIKNSKTAFQNLDKSVVTTGFLRDKATGYVNWLQFENEKLNFPVDGRLFRQVYFEMTKSAVDKQLPSDHDLRLAAFKDQDKHAFLVSIIDIDYQMVKPEVLQKIKSANYHLKKSQLETHHLFLAGVPAQRKYTGRKVSFDFNQKFYITNTKSIKYFNVNFGDGQGERRVLPGQIITVNYKTDGEKIINLTAYYGDGHKHTASFKVKILSPKVTPDETWNITADIPYRGAYGKVEVGIFYGAGHTSLTKPIVIVDGFDPENSRGIQEIYELANQQNMFDQLLARGFDAVVVNNLAGADYIQRNAFAFIKVIQKVNERMRQAGTYDNQIIVIGPSMGGLITRYGLRYMEQHRLWHNVKLWISFDSPQRGANVPLGLQHWVRFFADEGDSEDAQRALDALNSPAAQQMLIYHYTSTYTGEFPNPEYRDFYTEINNMGFPEKLRRVAIINGSGYGNGQPYGPGDQLIYYHYNSFLVDIVGDVWAVPDVDGTNTIFHGIIDILGPWYDEETITYSYTLPLDGAPGGDANTLEQLDNTDPGHGDIVAYYPDHSFIPTISSLALYGIYDPYYNVAANKGKFYTPFDAIYYPNWNQPHMHIDEQSKQWFLNEINYRQPNLGIVLHKINTTTSLYPDAIESRPKNQLVKKTDNQIRIFPNPANDIIYISNAQNSVLSIYDLSGRLVKSVNVVSNYQMIDVSDLSRGVYIVRLKDLNSEAQSKVMNLIVE